MLQKDELRCHPVEAESPHTYVDTGSPWISISAVLPLRADASWLTEGLWQFVYTRAAVAPMLCVCLCVCVLGWDWMCTTTESVDLGVCITVCSSMSSFCVCVRVCVCEEKVMITTSSQ